VKIQPLVLSFSQQMKVRRLFGSQAYNESTHEIRIEIEARTIEPLELVEVILSIVDTEPA
jgi:hypothetical protein